ncbi:ABC transporter permease [Frateuria sp. Soil773]|uniref:ABC transporter permease n=1 Tax=Frateuria sp. Soil773 TaxID=1736407 RepID=UPI0006FF83AC|nr:ABC transporter permease subunit [Frateuria sp. Soil773]KRF02034.1 ABC transporter permease [Frateuria sp. Soil773]
MSTLAVARLELRRLSVRPLAWVLGALTLAELAWRFTLLLGGFLAGQVKLAAMPGGPGYTDLVAVPLLSSMLTGGFLPFGLAELALVIVPLLTMSTLAGERGNGTLPLLFATGTPAWQIVLGKYLAVLGWLLLWLLLTLAMPLSVAHGTHLDWGKLAAATLGSAAMLAALAAVGLACSAYASHPAIAAAASLMLALALWIVNLGAQVAGIDNGVLNWLALGTHLETLLRGLVSSADLLWFVLVAAVALVLAAHRLAGDRERN